MKSAGLMIPVVVLGMVWSGSLPAKSLQAVLAEARAASQGGKSRSTIKFAVIQKVALKPAKKEEPKSLVFEQKAELKPAKKEEPMPAVFKISKKIVLRPMRGDLPEDVVDSPETACRNRFDNEATADRLIRCCTAGVIDLDEEISTEEREACCSLPEETIPHEDDGFCPAD